MKNKFRYNRCDIKTRDAEFCFLNEKINKNSSIKEIENILKEFYLKSSIRYFRLKHISEIAKNIKEDLGRNYQSASSFIEKNKAVSDIIDYPLSIDTCPNTGKSIIKIKEKIIYFDSDESAQIYLEKLKIKNM